MNDLASSNKLTRSLQNALFLCLLLAAIYYVQLRLGWIFTATFPQTTDGFFYLQEIKHRIHTGQGFYVGFSPFFKLIEMFSVISRVTSELVIFNFVVISSLLFFSLSLILCVKDKSKYWLLPGLFLLPWVSDVIFFRHYAFVKQAFSISIFLFGYALYLNLSASKFKSLLSPIALLCMAIGIVSHLFTTAVFIALLFHSFIFNKHSRSLGLIISFAGASALFLISFYREKSILKLWPIEYDLSWLIFCRQNGCYQFDFAEYIIYMIVFFCLAACYIWKGKFANPIFVFLVGYLLLLIPIWDVESEFVYRAAFSSIWLLIFAFSLGLRDSGLHYLAYPVIFIGLLISYPLTTHLVPEDIYLSSETLASYRKPLQKWIPETAFVHAPHGMQFKITYFLDRTSTKNISDRGIQQPLVTFAMPDPSSAVNCTNLDTPEDVPDLNAPCLTIQKGWRFEKES